jgi:Flp pilus assembly pilin Flp
LRTQARFNAHVATLPLISVTSATRLGWYPAIPEEGEKLRKTSASTMAALAGAANRLCSNSPLWRSLMRDHQGSIAVEFAILLPIQALLIVGGLDLALATLTAERLNFATEAAARCGAVKNSSCLTAAAISAWAAEQAAGIPNISAGNFAVSFDATCGGVSVVATYRYSGFVLAPIGLGAQACYVSEPAS